MKDNILLFGSGRYMNLVGTVISIKNIYSTEESVTLLRNLVRNVIKEENEACAMLVENTNRDYGVVHSEVQNDEIAKRIRTRRLVNELADDTIQALAEKEKKQGG
jgi:hypothetical protein